MIGSNVRQTTTRILALTGLILGVILLALLKVSSAQALPEYAPRTGEPCGTCHVNPGGGGPRTMRGLLWVGEGRPDEVPELEGILLAPGVDDPEALYDIACSDCHGRNGEGLSAVSLVDYELNERYVYLVALRGSMPSGMPSFKDQLTNEQIEIIAEYVARFNSGEIEPKLSYDLPPVMFRQSNPDVDFEPFLFMRERN